MNGSQLRYINATNKSMIENLELTRMPLMTNSNNNNIIEKCGRL